MKSWQTVSATEVQTGDVTDIGRVNSVTRMKRWDSPDVLVISHDMGRPMTVYVSDIVEVYR